MAESIFPYTFFFKLNACELINASARLIALKPKILYKIEVESMSSAMQSYPHHPVNQLQIRPAGSNSGDQKEIHFPRPINSLTPLQRLKTWVSITTAMKLIQTSQPKGKRLHISLSVS